MDSNMKSVLRSYLQKCGDGRNLEKFLRRNSYSSDERDISTPITTKCKNKTKSLESLTDVKDRTGKVSAPLKEKEKKTSEETEEKVEEKLKSMETKVVVKQSGEKLDKKKSHFNYESIIEITLPSSQANLIPPASHIPLCDRIVAGEDKEEPIKPIICTSTKPKIPSQNMNKSNLSPISTHESFVSNKQNPMEWDTFIPGYDESSTQQSFQLCNPMELGENEMNALKTYFQRHGLQLPNENLVVVIKNRQETNPEQQLSEIKRNKEKWQKIYEKYKEKYHKSTINFDSPEAQSTPKVQEEFLSSRMNEKSSQTSLVKNSGKSTQVEVFPAQQFSKECQVTVDKGTLSSKHSLEQTGLYHNQSEVAESFEFIAGSMKSQQTEKKLSSNKSDESRDGSQRDQLGESSKTSTKNEDISNFDDSLKVAIALLNSLLESRHMKPELKRNLAGKVIQKIVQIQTSRSIQTSTLGSSGIYPLSQSSQSNSSAEIKSTKENVAKDLSAQDSSAKDVSKSSKRSRESVLKDCFKPMTQSEVVYSHSIDEEPTKGSTSFKQVPKDQLMDYVKKEKQSHLKWIEKEIEHLRNLRDLLKKNESSTSIDPLYENLSSLLRQPDVIEKVSEDAELMPPPSTNPWNSHANNKKTNKHLRSKLLTPEPQMNVSSHEESLASFIDKKNRKFLEKYEKHHQVYEEVYTRPYNGKSKQVEAPRVAKALSKPNSKKTQITSTKDVQTSTSLASSSVFESSDSISVPVNTNNTKSSTTHYRSENFESRDKKSSSSKTKLKVAETQTSDSICRTRPIFESKKNFENLNFGTTSTTVTQRINRNTNDKQQQAHPPSVKYTLTFDKKSRANVREYMSLPQKTNSEYAISKSSKEIYNQISSSTLDNRHSEDKENYDADTIIDDDDEIDLQSCLTHKRPDIFTRFEERKRCIQELKKLRALRNEHRKKLLLLTSDKSLEGKLLNNLPELPLKTTRMFSTKALKLQTQKKLKNSTENLQKKNNENLKNLKRKNRLMTEIFNKNLQRNVLKGNMNLSNTVNLISK